MQTFIKNFSFIVIASVIFGALAVFIGQDASYDLLQYHYYNGFALLYGRLNKDIAPAMQMSYYNPLFDVINYLLISLRSPKLTTFLLGAFSGGIGFFTYKIAAFLTQEMTLSKKRIAIIFSLLIGLTGVDHLSLLNTTTNDTKLTLLILISFYYFLIGIFPDTKKTIYYFNLSGFVFGVAVGLKLVAVFLFPGFVIAYLYTRPFNKQLVFDLTCYLLAIAIGLFISNGVWMIYLYSHFKNPIFPFYNNFFHSPYLPFQSFNFEFKEVDIIHKVFFPIYFALKNSIATDLLARDSRILIFFLLFIISIYQVELPNYPRYLKASFIWFFTGYVVWMLLFFIYRYFLPLEILLGIFSSYIICKQYSAKISITILSMLVILFSVTTIYPDWDNRNPFSDDFFAVNAPTLPDKSTILLSSSRLAYTIPYFKQDHQYIGMVLLWFGGSDISLTGLKDNHFLFSVLYDLIMRLEEHQPVYLFSYNQNFYVNNELKERGQHQAALKLLSLFNIEEERQKCLFFSTKFHELELCPISLTRDLPLDKKMMLANEKARLGQRSQPF